MKFAFPLLDDYFHHTVSNKWAFSLTVEENVIENPKSDDKEPWRKHVLVLRSILEIHLFLLKLWLTCAFKPCCRVHLEKFSKLRYLPLFRQYNGAANPGNYPHVLRK